MLVLSRKVGESIVIGGNVLVTVIRVDGDAVRLGVSAPQAVQVHRQEIYQEIQRSNQAALTRERQKLPKLVKPLSSSPS